MSCVYMPTVYLAQYVIRKLCLNLMIASNKNNIFTLTNPA